jgi:hypothetical protein
MMVSKNKPAGRMNKYGVNFSREGNNFVLRKNFSSDKELIVIVLWLLWVTIINGKRLPLMIV